MNPLLSRVLGNSEPAAVSEDVPVPCAAVPRTKFRDRIQQRRKPDADKGDMQRVLGEAGSNRPTDDLIPDNAEEIDQRGQPINRGTKPVKDVVMEPTDPYAEKEKLMTPQAALVAPDVTPEADRPLDPSSIPGVRGRSFRTSDAESDTDGGGHMDSAAISKKSMDVLLGRSKPPTEADPDAVMTTESAYRMMGVQSPDAQAVSDGSGLVGADLLKEDQPMPDHVHSDGRKVLNVFRRFTG